MLARQWGGDLHPPPSPLTRCRRSAGRYGWSGGLRHDVVQRPDRQLIAIALTQTDACLFNGTLSEFDELAAQARTPGSIQLLDSARPTDRRL